MKLLLSLLALIMALSFFYWTVKDLKGGCPNPDCCAKETNTVCDFGT